MAVYLTEIPVDLALPPRQYPMPHQFAMGDNNAYTITSLLYDSRTPDMELLDGTVSGELVRPDGETVALTGEKGEEVRVVNADQGGMCNATPCSVTLPQACFAYPGRVTLTIKLTDGTTITQALSMSAVVVRTSTDVVVDPGEVVPDIGALQAAAAEATAAAADARAAASSAVRYDTDQSLTDAQKARARGNINAQERIEPDGAVALDLSDSVSAYISGDVGQRINYRSSASSTSYKMVAWVQAGCDYVLSVTNGETVKSANGRLCAVVDASGTILQTFTIPTVAGETVEYEFESAGDGYLCITVDGNATSVALHGGPLHGTVRYNTHQTLTAAQQEQARENIETASEAGFETVTGFVPFDGEDGTVTNRNLTVSRAGQRYTVSRASAHTSNTDLCFMPNLHAANYSSAGGNYDNWVTESRVALIPGKRYRMAVRVISGAFPTNERLNLVAMNDAGQQLGRGLMMANGSRYTDFTFEGTYLTIVGYARAAFATGEMPLVFDLAVYDSPEGASIADGEAYIARENHDIGGLMMWQGQLYKATQAIAAGETIAPGTNVTETTVAAQLAALEARIAALEG